MVLFRRDVFREREIRIYRISVEIFKKVLTLTLRHGIDSVSRGDKIENADERIC